MNLIQLVRGTTIEGLTLEEVTTIIRRQHSSISIRTSGNGSIILSNRKIIKCVNHYYEHPTKPSTKATGVNVCHTIHRDFGIEGVSANNCEACHLSCMAKEESKELRAIRKKSSTKRRK